MDYEEIIEVLEKVQGELQRKEMDNAYLKNKNLVSVNKVSELKKSLYESERRKKKIKSVDSLYPSSDYEQGYDHDLTVQVRVRI